MLVIVEIEEDGAVVKTAECEIAEGTTVADVARMAGPQLGITSEEIVIDLGVNGTSFEPDHRIEDCLHHGNRWRHRRTCVSVHFETEEARHHFPARAHWAIVHHWACVHFRVAKDACANLELRDGSPEGPAINENTKIGHFEGCMTVWLIKPGPEPFGYGA
jgi:hypothetical protein